MNNKRQQNENSNSSLKQMIIDFKRTLMDSKEDTSYVLQRICEIETEMNKNKGIYSKIDENTSMLYNRHQYNEKKMHFVMKTDYKHIQLQLKPNARAILSHMIDLMSINNGVAVTIERLQNVMGISKNPIRNALSELEECGCITKLGEHKKNGIGTLYMVNPEIAWKCKPNQKRALTIFFTKRTPETYLNTFSMFTICTDVDNYKMLIDDTPISFNLVSDVNLKPTTNTKKSQHNTDISDDFEYPDIYITDIDTLTDEELEELFPVN